MAQAVSLCLSPFAFPFAFLDVAEDPAGKLPIERFSGQVIADHRGDTYRVVYTVRFAERVYVLHVFQKKSKKGIATPKHEIELIKARLKRAESHYRAIHTKGA